MLRLGFRVMLGLDVSTGGNGARSDDFRGEVLGGNAGGQMSYIRCSRPTATLSNDVV